jgi:hypothetical protein
VSSPTSPRWSARDRLVGAVVVTYLVLQLVVPAVLLFSPRPQRFGWQMFTNAPVLPKLVLHRTSGRRDTVDIDRYFAIRRPELAHSDLGLAAAHVCRVIQDVALVELQVRPDSAPRLHECP